MRNLEKEAKEYAEEQQLGVITYHGYLAGARSMLPEIEALEKRNARLREALKRISEFIVMPEGVGKDGKPYMKVIGYLAVDIANEALRADEAGGKNG